MSFRRKLLVALLSATLLLGAGIYWLVATDSGLQFIWGRAVALSPVPLSGEVHGQLIGPLRVEGFRLELRGARVEVATADLDWQPSALWQGRLLFTRVALRELNVTVKPRAPGSPGTPPRIPSLPFLLDVHGVVEPLAVRWGDARELRFDRIALNAVAGPRQLKVRTLSLDGYGWHLDTEGEVGLRLDGEVQLATRWSYQPPQGERLRGHGRLTGTLSRPQTDQIFDAVLRGEAKGTLTWIDKPLAWTAEISTKPIDVSRLHRAWRPLVLGGRLRAEGGSGALRAAARGELSDASLGAWNFEAEAQREAGGWRVPLLSLAERDGPARLGASGLLHTDGGAAVELDVAWSELAFPLAATMPALTSPRGRIAVQGSLAGYRITGEGALTRPGLPDGSVQIEGEGDRDRLSLTSLRAVWLDGELVGDGDVQWRPVVTWAAELQARDMNPGRWHEGWPGRVAARVTTRGERRPTGLHAELTLADLAGELRGQPVAGNGRFLFDKDLLRVEALELRSGTARLNADGQLGAHWDLRWELEAARVEDLVPGLRGQVKAAGQLLGPRERPRLRVEGSGEQLAWAERRASRVALKADVDLAGETPWDLRLEADGVAVAGYAAEHLILRGEGGPADHRLALDGEAGGRSLHLEAHGMYADRRWRGELLAGRVTDPALGLWAQSAPAPLSITSGETTLQDWCWGRDDAAHLCLAGSGSPARGWQGKAALEAFPVAAVQPFINRDLQVTGRLDGHADLRYRGGLQALDVALAASDGVFRFQVSEREAISTPYRRVELTARAGAQGLQAQTALELANGDHARGEVALPRWRPGQGFADQPLRGNAEVALGEMVWVSLLAPDLVATGRLESTLTLGGTVARPVVQGNAQLVGGELAVPLLGIALADLQLEATADGEGAMAIRGHARSGPGQVSVNGRAAADGDGWTVAMDVKGENVEVVRLPQAHVLATPDLQVNVRRRVIQLSGTLRVPQARIDLPEIEAPVQASPDVVVVDRPETAPRAPRWSVISDVTVVFGDDVRLTGYGFSGRLGGQIVVVEPAGGGAIGRGELQVLDGKYEAYGQELTIEEGRLLYGNVPLNNPGIEFRAVRQMNEVKVGIVATGRLKKPEVRLYSDPVMDDTDALAYLVLGRPLETASKEEADLLQRAAVSLGVAGGTEIAREIASEVGVDVVNVEASTQSSEAALVFGKYLSPRLYVQYAVGLWEASNAWQMRYRLGTNWTIEAESGSVQSGMDVLYTIEK